MTRRDRLRGIVILCCNFGRNLAYYRTGWEEPFSALLDGAHPHASFWRQANSDFLDVAVLEWCKLMADRRDQHGWRRIVTNPKAFEKELLDHLRMTPERFEEYVKTFRHYRDKFVAHLDADRVMDIPRLDAAKKAVWFYHERIVTREAKTGDLTGLSATIPDHMELGYAQCQREAREVFKVCNIVGPS